MPGGVLDHLAALGAQPEARDQPRPRPQPQVRAHQHFIANPLAHRDPGVQAAQDRYQRRVREVHQALVDANNRIERERGANLQAEMDRLEATREARRQRIQRVDQQYNELRGLARQQNMNIPRAQNMPNEFGMDGPAVNAGDVGAGDGAGNDLAFDRLDAERVRRRQMNRWFEERPRNVPRQ